MICPQSHRHFHMTCPFMFSTLLSTVSFPYLLPVRSFALRPPRACSSGFLIHPQLITAPLRSCLPGSCFRMHTRTPMSGTGIYRRICRSQSDFHISLLSNLIFSAFPSSQYRVLPEQQSPVWTVEVQLTGG